MDVHVITKYKAANFNSVIFYKRLYRFCFKSGILEPCNEIFSEWSYEDRVQGATEKSGVSRWFQQGRCSRSKGKNTDTVTSIYFAGGFN